MSDSVGCYSIAVRVVAIVWQKGPDVTWLAWVHCHAWHAVNRIIYGHYTCQPAVPVENETILMDQSFATRLLAATGELASLWFTNYPHMPIGNVWIYRLLFVILFVCLFVCVCVCTVTDFSAEDKHSGVKFCTLVHRRPGKEISRLGNFAPPEAPQHPKMGYNWVCNSYGGLITRVARAVADSSSALATRRIGMCGYTAVPNNGRTC